MNNMGTEDRRPKTEVGREKDCMTARPPTFAEASVGKARQFLKLRVLRVIRG
jgi:hypothetical protein